LTGHKRRRKKADVSKLIATPVDPQVVVEDPEHLIEAVSRQPVLITEHEVALGAAVALSLPTPRHYPPRCEFLEHAEMDREMRRL
jgi:hypothetical protein